MARNQVDARLLAFLRDPASYPHHPAEVCEKQTHASHVFLVPPWVYKIKKPVDFGFLDFTTLEKRRHFCMREVELNSRLAPGVYQGVVPVTRENEGFALGGSGPAVEYAVKMVFLEPDGFLDARLRSGTAGEPELECVARTLAGFYRNQPSPPEVAVWGNVAKLRISTDENFAQTRRFIGRTIPRTAFDAIRLFTALCYERRRGLFERRVAGGWIRDCHGDLHLDHIHLSGGAPVIHDCIEFNDRLRHLDVASDAAFLAMDLDHHGLPRLARFFTSRLSRLMNDLEMERLLDFYQCYRAYVRGKVESLRAAGGVGAGRDDAVANARRYFRLALQYAVSGCRPLAVVVMGRVATGKSTLAAALAAALGWRLVSSDALRKSLAGMASHGRAEPAVRAMLYAPEMTDRTYSAMMRRVGETLRQGHGMILDATFSKRRHRDRLRAEIGDENLLWVVTSADDAATRRRLRMRETQGAVVSDARLEDQPLLDAGFQAPSELPQGAVIRISTAGKPEHTLRALLAAMVETVVPLAMEPKAAIGRAAR